MEDVRPGSFREIPDIPLPESIAPQELKPEPHPDLVAKYELFQKQLNPPNKVVYHPCGANDVSPSFAFPQSRVIYVELDEKAVAALQKEGFEAHHASALEFDPGEVDVLIMINPQISLAMPSSHITNGGYALTNDYHGTATELQRNPDFKLRGLIRNSRKDGLIFDTDKPEDYWSEIDTEEEFENAPFDWGSANYRMAADVVEALTGKRENVLAEYKRIIEIAKKEERDRIAQLAAENPNRARMMQDPDQQQILIVNHGEEQFIISTRLPRKKGTADDLFVFERVSKASPQTETK